MNRVFQHTVDPLAFCPEEPEPPKEKFEIIKYLSEIGKRGGLKGGPARAEKLSSRRRREIAKKAAKSRWNKKS